uniref:Uncharacterized protein n=1 Tax=Ditylenchus dipsaci TaxID=166011 RepID=A0A915DV36_9BILA
MAESYKDLLRELKRHSRILVYDWSKPSNADTIIYDIEKLEFDFYNWHFGDVLESWIDFGPGEDWNIFRCRLTDKNILSRHEVGELYIHPHEGTFYEDVMRNEVLKSPYSYGFTPKDKYQGLTKWRERFQLPEKWFDYYFKEAHVEANYNISKYIDPFGTDYNPDHLHH